ncbi:glycosyltransferase [Candidatus Uhrbacteria bacterium]|nr:glycosyltransferase [Candidatus Uhrbacteria bacterium]
MQRKHKNWIVSLSTYPPRACGIATYAASLNRAIEELYAPACESKVIAMNRDDIVRSRYPREVIFQIDQRQPQDYVAAAEKMNNLDRVKLVHIQHEFGIFGGEFGAHLLRFTETCVKPMVITFHTVLPAPAPAMRDVVRRLSGDVHRVTVMTQLAKRLLRDAYGVPEEKIDVIPHGIPPTPYQTSAKAKVALGFEGRSVLLTFGLLSRNKGIEYVIEALPPVVKRHPNALYLVLGATHPDVVQHEGEVYRASLVRRVRELGLEKNVFFYNEYVSGEDLLKFLQAADVYVATSLDPAQAVSGTLSYALGTGRPAISTAFAQAKELVSEDIGLLVDFRNPAAYAEAISRLLDDAPARLRMGREAYVRSRAATWPNAALATWRTYAVCVPALREAEMALPPAKLSHLENMTDDFGLVQFAKMHLPDKSTGYTVDDNARALLAATIHYEKFRKPSILPLIGVYLRFLGGAAHPPANFCNYVGEDRVNLVDVSCRENQEDARGRAFQALAYAAASPALPGCYRQMAKKMVDDVLASNPEFASPRAAAFMVDGLNALLSEKPDAALERMLRGRCDHLAALYREYRADDWEWFEPCLTYANSVLSEALLLAGKATGDATYLEIGKKTLDFLISRTFSNGMYVPIGQKGWCLRGGERSYFDQQPEDAAAMVRTLTVLSGIGSDARITELRRRAFHWFLGENMLGQVVYDRVSGGCYDGVGETSVNLNQGAESAVSYLLARLAMES